MNPRIRIISLALLSLATTVVAQPSPRSTAPGMSGGPKFDPAFRKLFAEHRKWSADLEIKASDPRGGGMLKMLSKLSMLDGVTRLDVDLTKVEGGGMQPAMAAQIKAMGMGEISTINLPAKKLSYMVYPGLEGYVEMKLPEGSDAPEESFKLELTELGKETIDGHPCLKKKFTLTGPDAKKREGTVWQATDMKEFPLRIEVQESGKPVTMTFGQVKLVAPAASLFEPPGNFKKHETAQALMQEAMMKHLGTGGAFPARPK